MNEQSKSDNLTSQDSTLATLEDKAKKLDALSEKFSKALQTESTPFSSALLLAQGIKALRELLDDRIMDEIMCLANTPLGFMTDRKDVPYKSDEVRDAIIEASLRGFRVAGNEFNIISARFYAAKAGLHRKVVSWPGVTDFREHLGIPKIVGDRGAVISATAEWRRDGVKQSLSTDFAIRVNSGMGSDAISGKAQRKLYAAVLNHLSGIITPEGEIDDASPVQRAVADMKQTANQWKDTVSMFAKLGVQSRQLLNLLGIDKSEDINANDLQTLMDIYTAINEGSTTVGEQFERTGGAQKPVFKQPAKEEEDFLQGLPPVKKK